MMSLAASGVLPCSAPRQSATERLACGAAGSPDGPKKLKVVVSDEESQGVCRPSVAWLTASLTRLKASSIESPGSRAALSNAAVYGLSAPAPSSASAPGEVE